MTFILALATLVVLSSIAVACSRAEAEAAERMSGYLDRFDDEADVVASAPPMAVRTASGTRRERHLRVVRAG
jgi:hypothetical protein